MIHINFRQERQYTIEEAAQILKLYIYHFKNVDIGHLKIGNENDVKLFEKALTNALHWYENER